jgi:tripartite-type tricarboxylate transporter receptor subunit TctC
MESRGNPHKEEALRIGFGGNRRKPYLISMVKRKEKTDMNRGKLSHLIPWLGFFLLVTVWVDQAQSQVEYPVRTVEIICPYSAGGSTDLASRIVADYAKRRWKNPANVINKTGGNSVPACVEVYGAKPDGYTLLADSQNSSSMLPVAVRNLPFKIMDRTFIGIWNVASQMVFVPTNSPIKNLKDLETEAKRDPESFTWSSMGGVGAQDYCIRQFLKAIGVDVKRTRPVMAEGGPKAMALAAGGHVKLGAGTVSSAIAGLQAGLVRGIGITGEKRAVELPDLPTFAEQGYPSVTATHWNGLSGPPKMPVSVLDLWDKLLQEMLKDPEVISRMKTMVVIPFYHNSSAMREFVVRQTEEIGSLWGVK